MREHEDIRRRNAQIIRAKKRFCHGILLPFRYKGRLRKSFFILLLPPSRRRKQGARCCWALVDRGEVRDLWMH